MAQADHPRTTCPAAGDEMGVVVPKKLGVANVNHNIEHGCRAQLSPAEIVEEL